MNFNFNQQSLDVARELIGRYIETNKGSQYQISATKAYQGESIQTQDKYFYAPGIIIMFNLKGHPHTGISTLSDKEQDYVLLNGLLDSRGIPINGGGRVSLELGLTMESDGKFARDLFILGGETSKKFIQKQGDAKNCLGKFYLSR